jgi:hypothetical protein
VKISDAAWAALRGDLLGVIRAGIETQHILADELDR